MLENKKNTISFGKSSILFGLKSTVILLKTSAKRIMTLVIPMYEVPSQFKFSNETKLLMQSPKIPLGVRKMLFQ
jgi:hypothetical protein